MDWKSAGSGCSSSTHLLRSSLIGLISILRRPMAREDGAVGVVQGEGGRGRVTTGLSQSARVLAS